MSPFLVAAALVAPLMQTPEPTPPAPTGTTIEVPMPTTKFCPYIPGVVGDADCIRSAVVPITVPAGEWVIRAETFDPDPEAQVDENVRITLGNCRFTTTALTATERDIIDRFPCTLTSPATQISFLFAEPDDNRYRSVFLRVTAIEQQAPPPTTAPPTTAPPTTAPPTTEPPGTVATTTTAPAATSTVLTTTTTQFAGPPTPPTASVPPAAGGGGDLPFTGADVDSLVLLGAGLLGLGVGTIGTAKGVRDRRR
jgi:hypothetical protein